jgi:tetratricopeptide (TPR) repeat protein
MLLTKARVLVYSGELEDALEATEQLLSHPGGEGSSTETRRLRFCVYMRQGHVAKALTEVEAILDKEGQVPRYAHLRAMLLGMQGQFALAEGQLDVAIDRGGGGSEAMLRRGMVRGCLQDWERAAIDLRHSMAYKDTPRARETLGRVYVCMRRWNDGLREVKKALKLEPTNALAQRALEEFRLPYDPMPLEVQGESLDDPYHVQRLASGQFPRFDNQSEEEEEEEEEEQKGREKEEEQDHGDKDKEAGGEVSEADDDMHDVKGEPTEEGVVTGATLPRPLPPLPPVPDEEAEAKEEQKDREKPAQQVDENLCKEAEKDVGASEPKAAVEGVESRPCVEGQREEAHD